MSLDVERSQMKQGFPGYMCHKYYEVLINEAQTYVKSGKEIKVLDSS